jgi:hypothetical protein
MHEPSDSTLLCDGVRVMTRLLRRADALPGALAIAPNKGRAAGSGTAEMADTSISDARRPETPTLSVHSVSATEVLTDAAWAVGGR